MGLFDSEMNAWFNEMHALASVSVAYAGLTLRGVQDESQASEVIIPGGIQGMSEGAVIVLKAECFATLPKPKDRISIDGKDTRILSITTEPTDPTLRITYGKL